jgi:protein required for attachment to host cells
MTDYCVVVMDGARARLFTLESAEFPEVESSPKLVEREDLVNPEKDLAGRELFSSNKTGRNRAPHGGPAHGYDDHRAQHEDEFERRFARVIAEHTVRLAHESRVQCVVLVAQPRMLGFLRQEMGQLTRNGFEVREVAKDLSKLSSAQVHDHLAKERLLPPCKRAAG